MLNKCIEVHKKIGFSEVETKNPKQNHALAATKDFVFITGGSYNLDSKSFEILVLKDNSLFRGPNMVHSRESHCSFIVGNYLYVMFGSSLDSYWSTMSYERIEVPGVSSKETLKSFYMNKKWEHQKLITEYNSLNVFKVFSCFKDLDSQVYCFGTYMDSRKEVKEAKMKVYWRETNSSFYIECKEVVFSEPLEEEEVKEASALSKTYSKDPNSREIFEESINMPFMDRGEGYLPVSQFGHKCIAEWLSSRGEFV